MLLQLTPFFKISHLDERCAALGMRDNGHFQAKIKLTKTTGKLILDSEPTNGDKSTSLWQAERVSVVSLFFLLPVNLKHSIWFSMTSGGIFR